MKTVESGRTVLREVHAGVGARRTVGRVAVGDGVHVRRVRVTHQTADVYVVQGDAVAADDAEREPE